MDGWDYVASRRLYTKAANGETVVAAEAGQTCDKVTPSSLPWLLEQGHVTKRVVPAEPPTPEAMATHAKDLV